MFKEIMKYLFVGFVALKFGFKHFTMPDPPLLWGQI